MKKAGLLFLLLIPGFFAVLDASSEEKPSIERGNVIFNDPALGTTGASCNTCHANGKGLENTANKKEWFTGGKMHTTLEEAVNYCIIYALKGKPLDTNSVDMQSLVLYVKSFSAKKPPVQK